MSKKSRKRNKKILAALALAGGAAMLAKRRGQGTASVNPVGGVDQIAADAATKVPYVTQKATEALAPASNFQTRFTKKVGNKWMGPNEIRLGNINPHEATLAAGAAYKTPITARPNRFDRLKGGGIAKRGSGVALKSGGRVTGIAKRGFGRALMKGKK